MNEIKFAKTDGVCSGLDADVKKKSSSGPNIGVIVGAVTGGIAVVALATVAVCVLLRRRNPAGHTGGAGYEPA